MKLFILIFFLYFFTEETLVMKHTFDQNTTFYPGISVGCLVKKVEEKGGMGMGGVSKHAKKEESVVKVNFGEEEFQFKNPEGYYSILKAIE